MVDRCIGHQAGLGKADGRREIRFDAGVARNTGFGVEPGREINGHRFRVGGASRLIHLESEASEWFPQGALRAEADQSIELHERAILRSGWMERVAQNRRMQDIEFVAGQRGKLFLSKRGADQNPPSQHGEVTRGDKGVASIVALARIAHDQSGPGEKLGNEARQLRANRFHQDVGGDAAGKCRLLDVLHFRAGEKHGVSSTRTTAG